MRIVPIVIVVAALAGCSRHPFERFFASGQHYLTAKKYSEAAIEFQNAVRADPRSIEAQMKLGDAYAAAHTATIPPLHSGHVPSVAPATNATFPSSGPTCISMRCARCGTRRWI